MADTNPVEEIRLQPCPYRRGPLARLTIAGAGKNQIRPR